MRIADLACDTGTLLKAAVQSDIDNYIPSAVEHSQPGSGNFTRLW